MNHIPIPEHFLPDHRIDVPFLVDDQTAYDNKGFLNFPSRIAIPLQSIVLGDLRGTSSSDWITFVQSWAYFGLLVEFFRTADIEVDVNEFLEAPSEDNGELLVTSRELPKYLRLWELKSRKTTRSEWRVRKRACVTYLQAASELVRDIGGLDQTGPERLFSAVRDLDADPLKIWQAVHLSAIILGEQLHDALETYYGTDLYPHFGRSLLLAQRMLIAGWCPSEIRMHEDQKLDQTTFYYFQLMDRRALGRDHGKCTSSHCWTEKIDWSTYRTAHVLGCACPQDWEDDSKARVWVEQVCHIVRRGSIALITAQANGAPGTCLQNPSETLGKGEHKIYVAISHVWSDGLGNDKSNQIPECQLLRLQKLVDALYEPSQRPVPFWLDTLCVPRQYPERDLAITAMRETYACADKVLVLDTVLSQVSKTADAAEILMSIRSSSWVRRLWTFHEAGLAKALYYQFSDHVLKNNEIYMTAAMEEFDRTIRLCQRENWDPSLLDSEVHPVDIDKEMGTAYNISRSISERMVNLSHIKAEAFRYLAVIEADAIKQHDPSNYRLLCQATRPLRWRSTSRIEDETICIAGVLGLDVAGLVGLNHIERMKRLLGQMKYVPADILFLDKPRIQGVGFRWMPTTFLGMGNDAGMSIAQAAEPTNDGLIVTTPGMVIFAPFRRALVRIDDLDLRRSRAFMNGESLFTKNDGRVYGISPLNSSFKWSDYNTTSIVIIWSLESRAKSIRTGQIVQVDKQENGTIYCHIECQILIVSWTADELKERFSRTWEALTFTDSEPLLTTQRWCVG